MDSHKTAHYVNVIVKLRMSFLIYRGIRLIAGQLHQVVHGSAIAQALETDITPKLPLKN